MHSFFFAMLRFSTVLVGRILGPGCDCTSFGFIFLAFMAALGRRRSGPLPFIVPRNTSREPFGACIIGVDVCTTSSSRYIEASAAIAGSWPISERNDRSVPSSSRRPQEVVKLTLDCFIQSATTKSGNIADGTVQSNKPNTVLHNAEGDKVTNMLPFGAGRLDGARRAEI